MDFSEIVLIALQIVSPLLVAALTWAALPSLRYGPLGDNPFCSDFGAGIKAATQLSFIQSKLHNELR